LGRETSHDIASETSRKIANVIHCLITKENILVVIQDSRVKNDRYLGLSINTEFRNTELVGSNEPVY